MNPTFTMLAALALVGGGWDLATRRIPNWLTLPMIAAGIAWNTYSAHWHGLMSSLLGFALGTAILLPFFILGGTGAGDVKMLAAAGAIVGGYAVIFIFLYFAIIGGIVALAMAAAHGHVGRVLMNTIQLFQQMTRGDWHSAQQMESAAPRMAYGAVIAAGCLFYMWQGPKTI